MVDHAIGHYQVLLTFHDKEGKMAKAKEVLLILLPSALLFADVGKLTFVSGNVEVDQGRGWQKANLGAVLREKDKVRTGQRSSAIVQLRTGAALKLKSNSSIDLAQVGDATTIEVGAGSVFSSVSLRNAGQSFRIRAQTMVAAVRGTQFFVAYGKKQKEKSDLWLCVNEGVVHVSDTATKSEVDVRAGEGIIIPTDRQIPKPRAYAWTKKLNWNMDASKGDVEDRTDIQSAYQDLQRMNYD
ncbi:MAG: FecR family protein [Turneriella sp.]|nr:FecR family protein [Turneriella sp.]